MSDSSFGSIGVPFGTKAEYRGFGLFCKVGVTSACTDQWKSGMICYGVRTEVTIGGVIITTKSFNKETTGLAPPLVQNWVVVVGKPG